MAIVATSVLEARRAAKAAAAATASLGIDAADFGTAPEVPSASPGSSSTVRDMQPPVAAPPQRRGHAVKDESGKWQPTGDYDNGFARAPVDGQFKEGGKGGPGRPKGSQSHDALMEKHLGQKREVSVGGRRKKLSTRELLVMATIKAALEGKDKRARDYVLAMSLRLYPSRDGTAHDFDAPALSASDLLSLAEYEQELRDQIRKEVRDDLKLGRIVGTGEIK